MAHSMTVFCFVPGGTGDMDGISAFSPQVSHEAYCSVFLCCCSPSLFHTQTLRDITRFLKYHIYADTQLLYYREITSSQGHNRTFWHYTQPLDNQLSFTHLANLTRSVMQVPAVHQVDLANHFHRDHSGFCPVRPLSSQDWCHATPATWPESSRTNCFPFLKGLPKFPPSSCSLWAHGWCLDWNDWRPTWELST